MVKVAGSLCCSASSRRTTVTAWAKSAVVDDPAPRNASPWRTALASAVGARPPNQIGGCGRCTGLGAMGRSSTSRNRPWNFTRGLSDHAAFIRARPSVKYRTWVATSTPKAANLREPPPAAIPRSRRPWLSRSTAVTAEASCNGSCSEVTRTPTPSRSRAVQAAEYASSSNGASSGDSPTICSSTHPPSNPNSSARPRYERSPAVSKSS